MEFDIQGLPPTINEINQQRAALSADWGKIKPFERAANAAFFVCLFALMATIYFFLFSTELSADTATLASVTLPLVPLSAFGGSMFVGLVVAIVLDGVLDCRLSKAQRKLDDLDEIEPAHKGSKSLLVACEIDPACNQYNMALVQQGRRPVVAERKAMIKFSETAEERAAEQRLRSGVDLFKY